MQVQKYGEINLMIQKVIYGVQVVLHMKWHHLNLLLEHKIWKDYIEKFKKDYMKEFLQNLVEN